MSELFQSLPDGWDSKALGDICNIDPEMLSGATDPNYTFRYIDISSVGPSKISNNLTLEVFRSAPSRARKRVQKDDVLMATVRPNLKAFAKVGLDGELVASTGFAVLRAIKDKSHPEFLKQILFSADIESQVESLVAGSNYPAITVGNVRRLHAAVPPYAEQRGIAEVLSALDEQIEQTDELIEKFVARRAGLVQEFLVPETRKAKCVTLAAASSLVTSGSRGWARFYQTKGALFLRIGNLTRENPNLDLDDLVRVVVPAGGEGARTRLEAGDVLISITADLGVIGCIPENFEEAYINQHIALVRINDASINPRWVAHVLGSPFGNDQIARLNDGGAKAGLNLSTIRALQVPKPSIEIQDLVVNLLDAADVQISAEKAFSAKLRLQKQGLMRDLLTGKTRV